MLDVALPDWLPQRAKGLCVAGYVTNGREPDVLPWLAVLGDCGVRAALPHIATRSAPMSFRAWSPGTPLDAAPLGFRQPDDTAALATPDVILTPLVGFDRAGHRLGQGAGYYDRAFQASPDALRIGIAWSVQDWPGLPVDAWDVPLDLVVTEAETIVMPHARFQPAESQP